MTRLDAELMVWLSGWYTRTFVLHRWDGRVLIAIQ